MIALKEPIITDGLYLTKMTVNFHLHRKLSKQEGWNIDILEQGKSIIIDNIKIFRIPKKLASYILEII